MADFVTGNRDPIPPWWAPIHEVRMYRRGRRRPKIYKSYLEMDLLVTYSVFGPQKANEWIKRLILKQIEIVKIHKKVWKFMHFISVVVKILVFLTCLLFREKINF